MATENLPPVITLVSVTCLCVGSMMDAAYCSLICQVLCIQDNTWQLGKVLGKASSGSVLETLSLHYPNVVLKQGPHKKIEAEAEKLWQLDHPNIASVYATLHSQELGANNEFVGYMALERLGPSLCAMRDAQKM